MHHWIKLLMPLQPIMMTDHSDDDTEAGVLTKTRPKTKRPPRYKVLLLNDDYTPMEFVVMVLERFFGMTHAQAFEIMLTVHKKGVAVVGVFSHEVAETKVGQVMDFAHAASAPAAVHHGKRRIKRPLDVRSFVPGRPIGRLCCAVRGPHRHLPPARRA